MKTLKELRFKNPYETRKMGCNLKSLKRLYKIDFNVYLESRKMNLQRPLVWTLYQKRELVWSVFLDRPIPDIAIINRYPDESDLNVIEIIDGKQRFHTLLEFLDNQFTIEIEGIEYFLKDLPYEYQIEFENYYVRYIEVLEYENKIPDSFKIEWFKQINFAGTPQEKEHIDRLN